MKVATQLINKALVLSFKQPVLAIRMMLDYPGKIAI